MARMEINAETTTNATGLAAALGVSARRVKQLAQDGIFVKVAPNEFNLAECIRVYIDVYAKGKTSEDKSLEQQKLKADTDYKRGKAQIALLEAQELEGEMHRSEDVEAMTTDLIYVVRSALMALPGRLAVDVVNCETAPEASAIIKKEVYHLMEDLSNYEYDPLKYEARVRERQKWSEKDGDTVED